MKILRILIFIPVLLLAACNVENYETGDDEMSYMRADFARVHSGEAGTLVSAVTDEGDSLVLTPPLDCEWATTPDSTYRALLYYKAQFEGLKVEGIQAANVLTLRIPEKRPRDIFTDPVHLQSSWVSTNRQYLNLSLGVMTGKVEGSDAKQGIGIVRDTVTTADDGHQVHHLRLYHNQNGQPEYYTSRLYVSVPLTGFKQGDEVRMEVNTYAGKIVKSYIIQP